MLLLVLGSLPNCRWQMIRQAAASDYNTSDVQTVIDCLLLLPMVRWLIHFLLCLMGIVSKSIDYQLWTEFGGIFFYKKVDHIVKQSHLLPRFSKNNVSTVHDCSSLSFRLYWTVCWSVWPASSVQNLLGINWKLWLWWKLLILILRLMLLIRPGDHFVWYPLSLLEQLTKAGSETRAGSEDD